MHRLIEQFLKAHHHAVEENSIFNISLALDREALIFYAEAQAEANRRLQGKQSEATNLQRILKNILAVRLTQALTQIDLRDSAAYTTLTQAIEHWCPWQAAAQQSCLLLQQILLSLLPAVQQKQHLDQLCSEYQNHLQKEIEEMVASDYPQAHFASVNSQNVLFGAPPVADRPQVKLIQDSRPPIARLVADRDRYLVDPSPPLAMAMDKYEAVSKLRTTLKNPIKSARVQLEDFRVELDHQRPVIEKGRDTWAMKFMKGIVTLLSLGLAYACGIWGVKGKTATDSMQNVLKTPQTPARIDVHEDMR